MLPRCLGRRASGGDAAGEQRSGEGSRVGAALLGLVEAARGLTGLCRRHVVVSPWASALAKAAHRRVSGDAVVVAAALELLERGARDLLGRADAPVRPRLGRWPSCRPPPALGLALDAHVAEGLDDAPGGAVPRRGQLDQLLVVQALEVLDADSGVLEVVAELPDVAAEADERGGDGRGRRREVLHARRGPLPRPRMRRGSP
ncbi:MAG: hypothetical protein ACLTYW_00075 [Collinsella sp.]